MEKRLQSGKLTFYFQNDGLRKGLGKFRLLHPKILNLVYQFRKLSTYRISSIWHKESMPHMILIIWVFVRIAFSVSDILHLSIKQLEVTICFQKRKINLLWCGRMLKLKRVDLLIKAFCDLQKKNNNIHLTLVGNGPASKCLIKYLHKHALPSNYTLYDFLPVTEVRYLMQQADICTTE